MNKLQSSLTHIYVHLIKALLSLTIEWDNSLFSGSNFLYNGITLWEN